MKLQHTLNRVTFVLLISFLMVALSLGYWSLVGGESLLARSDNPRLVEAERAIQRGMIVDRNEAVLAKTERIGVSVSGKPIMQREYPFGDDASVVGYYSFRYGVGGVEAAFDSELRGTQTEIDRFLHRVQAGSDLQLTIDMPLQQAIINAMGRNPGAVVVVDVPSGAVRALISLPGYDPENLDDTYSLLRLNPFAPLLNRVTQGIYQPGGALQTIILATMLTDRQPLNQEVINAQEPIRINGLTMGCINTTTTVETLADAYAQACPSPFVDAAMSAPGDVQDMLTAFGLLQAPTLIKFGTVSGRTPTALTSFRDPVRLRAQASGQGDLTVTPLQMALVAATIANKGNTVTPYLVQAIRAPNTDTWQPLNTLPEEHAVITTDVTDFIRAAMRDAVTRGAASAADQPDMTVYGHASYAYTGLTNNSWFIGFVEQADGQAVVVAVALEGKNDPSLASKIGGIALRAAAQ
jgi:peptidoglycan glycosyltransferase